MAKGRKTQTNLAKNTKESVGGNIKTYLKKRECDTDSFCYQTVGLAAVNKRFIFGTEPGE